MITGRRSDTIGRIVSDAEFVAQLRAATQDYLDSVDLWESAYQRFYRLASPLQVSSDLEPEHQAYLAARKRLISLAPAGCAVGTVCAILGPGSSIFV